MRGDPIRDIISNSLLQRSKTRKSEDENNIQGEPGRGSKTLEVGPMNSARPIVWHSTWSSSLAGSDETSKQRINAPQSPQPEAFKGSYCSYGWRSRATRYWQHLDFIFNPVKRMGEGGPDRGIIVRRLMWSVAVHVDPSGSYSSVAWVYAERFYRLYYQNRT